MVMLSVVMLDICNREDALHPSIYVRFHPSPLVEPGNSHSLGMLSSRIGSMRRNTLV